MCGRYLRRSDKQRLAEAFRIANDLGDMVLPDWDYNVAPTTIQPVIRLDAERQGRELVLMRWGLVPWFAKSLKDFGYNTINARADALESNRMWQGPLERRRCLVPADGFYEWKVLEPAEEPDALPGVTESPQTPALFEGASVVQRKPARKPAKKPTVEKQPYAFTLRSGAPFAFAGLWERWRDPAQPGAAPLESFTIITTDPNELTSRIHTRMPAILAPADYAAWLQSDPGIRPPVELLRPFPADKMQADQAHRDVGNPRNNHAGLLDPNAEPPRNSA